MECALERAVHIRSGGIIVDADGEIIDYELNSPFVYLRSLVQDYLLLEIGKVVRNRSAKGYLIKTCS